MITKIFGTVPYHQYSILLEFHAELESRSKGIVAYYEITSQFLLSNLHKAVIEMYILILFTFQSMKCIHNKGSGAIYTYHSKTQTMACLVLSGACWP